MNAKGGTPKERNAKGGTPKEECKWTNAKGRAPKEESQQRNNKGGMQTEDGDLVVFDIMHAPRIHQGSYVSIFRSLPSWKVVKLLGEGGTNKT
jgi:hypothetical protein